MNTLRNDNRISNIGKWDVHRELFLPLVSSRSCLFHHNFKLYDHLDGVGSILLLRTSPMSHFLPALFRIAELSKSRNIYVITNEPINIYDIPLSLEQFIYPKSRLNKEILNTFFKQGLNLHRIERIFITIDERLDPCYFSQFEEKYKDWWNLYQIARALDLDKCYFIDHSYYCLAVKHIAKARLINTSHGAINIPHASMFQEECQLAYDLAHDINAEGETVEFGQFLGGSSICLALGCKHSNRGNIWSVESQPQEIASENFLETCVTDNIFTFKKSIEDFKLFWQIKHKPIRLLYYDACKDFVFVLNDLLFWDNYVSVNGKIVLQDYNSTGDVARAAHAFLKLHENYTIDKEIMCSLVITKTSKNSRP